MCFSGGAPPQVPSESGYASSSNSIGNSAQSAAGDLTKYTQAGAAGQNAQTGMAQGQLNQAGTANLQGGQAGLNMYQNTAIPAAQQNIQQSQQWGSPSGVAGAQAAAGAQTAQSYNAARLNNQRQLGSYGVDPSQMKSGALNLNANLQQAGATGNASYTAGQNRQLQGINLTNQAVGTANQTAGVGAAYGQAGSSDLNSSTQLGNQTLATTTQAQLAPSQYDSTALQGYGQAGNLTSQGYQNQLAGAQYANTVNTGEAGGIGQGIGAIGGLVADYYSGSADGGAMPSRYSRMGQAMQRSAQPQRFDDGGSPDESSNIPSATTSMNDIRGANGSSTMSNTEADTIQGGTNQRVGLTPQQQDQLAQSAMMQGAAKGFAQTYKANGGAIPGRTGKMSIQKFDEGGSVNVPNINISGPQSVAITHGGAAPGQSPSASSQAGAAGGLGGALGGMGGLSSMMGGMGGINGSGAFSANAGSTSLSDSDFAGVGGGLSDVEDAGYADGGSMAQGVPPQVGIPGPWTAANGGPAPPRYPGEIQPSANGRLPGFANGGGPSQSMGSPPGTFISQGASDGTGIDDQVPAKVSVGEYVIPADVVHAKGKEFFDKLVQRYHTPAQQQRQQMGMPQHGMPQQQHGVPHRGMH